MSIPVKFFHSGMAGAPVLSNNWGDMVALLDACLVNGFNLTTVTSITWAAGIATATIAAGHQYQKSQVVLLSGVDQAAYNGEFRILSVTANSFTFAVDGTPTSPATTSSAINCRAAPLGWEIVFSGTNKRAYRSLDPASTKNILLVDDGAKGTDTNGTAYANTWAKWAAVGIVESMSDINTITGAQAPFDPHIPKKNWEPTSSWVFGWHKWYHAMQSGYDNSGDSGAGARNWVLVGDGSLFFLMNTTAPGYNFYGRNCYCFGDIDSFKSGDAYRTVLQATDRPHSQTSFSYPSQYGGTELLYERQFVGSVMLRNYTQLGTPIRFTLISPNFSGIVKGSGRGNVPFPNGPDYSLWMLPTYVQQEDNHVRGAMPGLRWIVQDRPMSDGTLVDNVVNEPGKEFMIFSYGRGDETEWGRVAFDITGPWR